MEDKQGQGGEGRRQLVSPVQVAAGALAAISAAVAASYVSVGGTIIGAAVGSVVTTTAGAVYSHYLERTQTRLKQVVTPVLDRSGNTKVVVAEEPVRPDAADPPAPDLERPAESDKAALTAETPPDQTAAFAAHTPTTPGATAGAAGAAARSGAGIRREISWRWLAPLSGMAVLVFAIALGSISLFETASGQPLHSTVRGEDGSGSSIGNFVNSGSSSDRDPRSTPAPTSTPTTPDSTGDPDSSPDASPETTGGTESGPPDPGETQPGETPSDQSTTGQPGQDQTGGRANSTGGDGGQGASSNSN